MNLHSPLYHSLNSEITAQKLIYILKGRIWSLDLKQAQKYYQISMFVNGQNEKQIEQLYKIKILLERRIDKLNEVQILEKQKTNQLLKLKLLEKQIYKVRLQIQQNPQLQDHYVQNTSNIQLQSLLQQIHNNMEQISSINIQSKPQLNQTINNKFKEDSYNILFNNLENISTQQTGAYSNNESEIDFEQKIEQKRRQKQKHGRKKTIKNYVFENLYSKAQNLLGYLNFFR